MHKQVFDATGSHIGTFDGEYVYDFSGKLVLRVDGNEVYTTDMPCKYVGVFEKSEARGLDSSILFRLKD